MGTQTTPATSHLVLAEDDVLVRMVTAEILTEEGHRVHEAAHAEEALKLLEARPDIRALVTDVNMPGEIDGLALARLVAIRWPSVRILVLSGKVQAHSRDLPAGARFLGKPCTPSTLLSVLAELLAEAPGAEAAAAPVMLQPPATLSEPSPTPGAGLPTLHEPDQT